MAFLQTINESFTEEEMKRLKEAKKDMTWREFIKHAAELQILYNNQKEDAETENMFKS